MSRIITILIAARHELLGDGLAALLDSRDDIRVMADIGKSQAGDAELIITDAYGGYTDVERVRSFAGTHPDAGVLVLSPIHDKYHIGQMLKVGSRGYVNLAQPQPVLIEAVRMLAADKVYRNRSQKIS